MAKSTSQGDSYTERELADPHPPVVITRSVLAGEKAWTETDGTDSLESSKKEGDSERNPKTGHQPTAPMTGNPSSPAPTGSGAAPTITTSGLEQLPVEPYTEWPYTELQTECKARDLSASGKKEELVQRLEQWDIDNPEDDTED